MVPSVVSWSAPCSLQLPWQLWQVTVVWQLHCANISQPHTNRSNGGGWEDGSLSLANVVNTQSSWKSFACVKDAWDSAVHVRLSQIHSFLWYTSGSKFHFWVLWRSTAVHTCSDEVIKVEMFSPKDWRNMHCYKNGEFSPVSNWSGSSLSDRILSCYSQVQIQNSLCLAGFRFGSGLKLQAQFKLCLLRNIRIKLWI